MGRCTRLTKTGSHKCPLCVGISFLSSRGLSVHARRVHLCTVDSLMGSSNQNPSLSSDLNSSDSEDQRRGDITDESSSDDPEPSGRFGALPASRTYHILNIYRYLRI